MFIFVTNFVTMALLTIIWSKSDWINFIIKVCFFSMAVANAFYAAQSFGYLVKIGG